jgi:homoserine dehydrogenase
MSVDSFLTVGSSPGPHCSRPAALVPPRPHCRVAILGLGTVGTSLARRLLGHPTPGLELTHILDRRIDDKRHALPGRCVSTTRVEDILTSDVDIVVELIGGISPSAEWIEAALRCGKSVVTANTEVIARFGPSLLALAARQGRQLRYEAAVGGAMPIVRAVGDGLAGDRVTRIVAILNGTSNALLSEMEATGCTLADALEEARARGVAEVDPSADLDGLNARAKLVILCALAFRLRVDPTEISTRSIAAIGPSDLDQARRRGATIRQLACAEYDAGRSGLTAWVAPAIVECDSIFARIVGPQNAAVMTSAHAGDVGIFGAGAGGEATAVALIADLLAIARDRAAIVPAPTLHIPASVTGLDRGTHIVDLVETGRRLDDAARRRRAPGTLPRGTAYAEAV